MNIRVPPLSEALLGVIRFCSRVAPSSTLDAGRLTGRALRWAQAGALKAWAGLGVAAERVDPAMCWTCKVQPLASGGLTCTSCRSKAVTTAPAGTVAPNAPGGSS